MCCAHANALQPLLRYWECNQLTIACSSSVNRSRSSSQSGTPPACEHTAEAESSYFKEMRDVRHGGCQLSPAIETS